MYLVIYTDGGDTEQVIELTKGHYFQYKHGLINIIRTSYIAGSFLYEEWRGDDWEEVDGSRETEEFAESC